jgi:hypothetical protein
MRTKIDCGRIKIYLMVKLSFNHSSALRAAQKKLKIVKRIARPGTVRQVLAAAQAR